MFICPEWFNKPTIHDHFSSLSATRLLMLISQFYPPPQFISICTIQYWWLVEIYLLMRTWKLVLIWKQKQ